MTDHQPLTTQQLDNIRAVTAAAAQIGADIDPGTVTALLADNQHLRTQLDASHAYEQRLREQHDHDVAELNRLRQQNGFLFRALAAKDAKSDDADKALREFLTAGTDDDAAARPAATTQDGRP